MIRYYDRYIPAIPTTQRRQKLNAKLRVYSRCFRRGPLLISAIKLSFNSPLDYRLYDVISGRIRVRVNAI